MPRKQPQSTMSFSTSSLRAKPFIPKGYNNEYNNEYNKYNEMCLCNAMSVSPKYVANVLERMMNVLPRADLIEILRTYGIIRYMLSFKMMSKDVAPLRNLIFRIAANEEDKRDKDFVSSLLNAAIDNGSPDWASWLLAHFRLDDDREIEAMNALESDVIFNGLDEPSADQKLALSVMMSRSWFQSQAHRWDAVVRQLLWRSKAS